MKHLELKQQLAFCDKYKINANALLLLEIILLAQDNEEPELVKSYFSSHVKNEILPTLTSLQNAGLILKSYKLPKQGEKFSILDIPLNKNMMKDFYRSSFEMGVELYESYPISTFVNGDEYKLRRISKKFDSLEDAYMAYGKAINWKPETHKRVLELIDLGKKSNYRFTNLGDFIVDHDWLNMETLATDSKQSNITML